MKKERENEKEIEALKKIKDAEVNKLTTLNLSYPQLTSLLPKIGQLTNITSLPPEIGQLTNLTELNLMGNKLISLPPEIGQLTNLTKLILGGNLLTTLPPEIGQLTNLTTLGLGGNLLTTLPPEIAQLKKLKELGLHGDPLDIEIPPEILNKDAQTILNYYFKHKEGEKRPLNEAKLILVGQGSVGKTSLVNLLVNNEFNPNENQTKGIEITDWSVHPNGEEIRVHIWDFGGQEIMHATHQFFLTKRSLYLLVVDNRQEEEENRLEYWIKMIESFGENSPIILVGNKSDQKLLDINETKLKRDYPNIKAIINTSCEKGDGIQELNEIIAKEIDSIEYVHQSFLESWFEIKEKIGNDKRDIIPYDEYSSLCNKKTVDEQSQETLIGFLHDLGIIIYFKDDLHLETFGILNPEWITNAVYSIINSNELFQQKGILNIDQLSNILDSKYKKAHYTFILNIMERFELCVVFDGSNKNQYLIPAILPKDEAYSGDWDQKKGEDFLSFEFHYRGVLPNSILSRFIVRMHSSIKQNTCWRTGVLLEENNNEALVKANLEDKKITIWVRGPLHACRDFLQRICSQLDSVHQTIAKLEAVKKVPVPNTNVVVDYNHLLTLEEKGIETFIPEGLKISVSVKELLNGIDVSKIKTKISKEATMKNPIRILHLSDLHLKSDTNIDNLTHPLFTDLEDQTDGIGIDKIDYLVITGDFTNKASKDEFQKAEEFCRAIKKQYSLSSERLLLVPGNHDLDWDEEVYEYTSKRKVDPSKLEAGLKTGKMVDKGEDVLIRNDSKYPDKFNNFSNVLYRILTSEAYPINFNEQCIPIYFEDHKIQFILMNSSWEIDEYFPDRSGISIDALSKGLLSAKNQVQGNNVLKIVCWHHPINGNEKIFDDAFMEKIQKADIKLCLHGHVHEGRVDLLGHLHPTRKIHITGAGSFDAPSEDRPESIPRVYNLIEISEDHILIRVHTRCKMKETGAWDAWARWPGDEPHSKRSYYNIT